MTPFKRILAVAALVASAAYAQSSSGSSLDGLILDPSGKPIAGAAVMVYDTDRGLALNTLSGEDGFYRFPRLSPGRFELNVTTSITVDAAAAAIQAQSAEVSSLISGRKIEQLSLNGRNFQRLILLAPGAGPADGDVPPNPSFSGTPFR